MRRLLMGAAVAGGLYWASKQEGGIPGVWSRFQDRLKEVQDSPDPLGTLKGQLSRSSGQIEPASVYSPLPEHPTSG